MPHRLMAGGFAFLLVLILPSVVSASFISLTTTISDATIENTTQTNLRLSNSGDEAAFNLYVSLILPEGFNADAVSIEKLNPDGSFEGNFTITMTKDVTPGRYPVVVLTEYTDANGYLFSSVSPSSVVYQTSTISKLSGSISEVTMEGKGSKKLVLTVKNLDDVSHDVKIKLFLPRELKATELEKTAILKSKEEKQLDFEVSNLAALEGSSYVVLASIGYQDSLNYNSFATGIVNIVSHTGPDFSLNYFFLIALAIIVTIIIIYNVKKK